MALLAGGSQSANLNDPTALDASMANADDDDDPAVTPIIEAPADAPARDADPASRPSRSPQPPRLRMYLWQITLPVWLRKDRRHRV